MNRVAELSPSHPMKRLAVRVGHDAVWIAIAGLFCIVEGAVKLSEYAPKRFVGTHRTHRSGPATSQLALR